MHRALLLWVMLSTLIFPSRLCRAEELTPGLAKQKVEEAVALLEREGRAGFAKLRDPRGPFRFANGEGYVWVNNIDGLTVVQPMKPALEGTPTLTLKDSTGFRFIKAMNSVATQKGCGWVAYLWPKPGTSAESPKISFVQKTVIEGRTYVVGCGIYDVTEEALKTAMPAETVISGRAQYASEQPGNP